ncbi:hypothetical protein D6833_01900 [Candidatus Parcubacteria bacterium]|nr:MAG: hypothetical protein D6833_01900 [Candidatus Parcubacteria bacterium]
MLALLTYWVKQDNSFYQSALQRGKVLRRVEYVLLNHGLRSPSEVFTTSFNLYFSFPPYHPRVNGGWDRFSLWGYNQEYPELPVVSLEGFLTACAEQGIRYLVLSPKAGLVADFLRDIYESRDTAELEFLAASGQLRIYQLHIR